MPLKASRVKKPAEAMLYTDTRSDYLYSPLVDRFKYDMDRNGALDSAANDFPFNEGRPTVHNNGANVTLLDGHVEWVAFKKFWQVDGANQVVHPFWYLEGDNLQSPWRPLPTY